MLIVGCVGVFLVGFLLLWFVVFLCVCVLVVFVELLCCFCPTSLRGSMSKGWLVFLGAPF